MLEEAQASKGIGAVAKEIERWSGKRSKVRLESILSVLRRTRCPVLTLFPEAVCRSLGELVPA